MVSVMFGVGFAIYMNPMVRFIFEMVEKEEKAVGSNSLFLVMFLCCKQVVSLALPYWLVQILP